MIHFAQNAVLYRKSDGKSPEETGVAFSAYDSDRGFICENAKQKSGYCDDYEVRFCCPSARCEWTRWMDRDDPGGTGDWEHLEGLRKDLGACSNPADIQARRYGWKMESSDWISASSVLSHMYVQEIGPEAGRRDRRVLPRLRSRLWIRLRQRGAGGRREVPRLRGQAMLPGNMKFYTR